MHDGVAGSRRPARTRRVRDGGVFWLISSTAGAEVTEANAHRLVWLDWAEAQR